MGENSAIEWTDHTFNPWWGCTKCDPGCVNCYAERMSSRWKRAEWGPEGERVRTSEANWKQPLKWNQKAQKTGESARVFCASMCDVFDIHHSVKREWLDELMYLIDSTLCLDWMFLTKRAVECRAWMRCYCQERWRLGKQRLIFPNLWIGASVCDMKGLARVPVLLDTFAEARFLSMEPLLEPVTVPQDMIENLDLVIVGCESGPGARPMELDWVRSIRDQCQMAGTRFFFKQAMIGGKLIKTPALDGIRWDEMPPRRKL